MAIRDSASGHLWSSRESDGFAALLNARKEEVMGEALPYTQREIEKIIDRGVFKGFLRFDDIEVVMVFEVQDKTYEFGLGTEIEFAHEVDPDLRAIVGVWLRERR